MSFSPTMTLQQQRGGTFLGIILGVVFGLAVALGVAIYVAKVPIPFVNKNTSRSSDQDAAEAEKNRAWDPNAPLRGKNGARGTPNGSVSTGAVAPAPEQPPLSPAEVAAPATRGTPVPAPAEAKPAESRTADNRPATRSEKASEPATASKPSTPAQRAPSGDPLGDFAAARAGNAAKPAPAAAASDPFTYFVQAGAFRTPEDADAQRARLSLMGVEARVSEREQAGRTVYRVRVGPFQNHDAASRVKERLDGSGFDSALVRVAR